MSEDKLFEIFLNKVKIDITDFLVPGDADLNEFQKKAIEDATLILKENIVGDVKKLGGNLKKNEDKFKQFEKKAEEELMQDSYKSIKKDLKDFLKDYIKNLKKLIERTCIAIIPVKEMPWAELVFRTLPRLNIQKKKCSLIENAIAYYGEIKCVISRTTIYGKMKGVDPLFAPYMGELDLGGYKLDDSEQKAAKSQVYPYVSAVINSFDNTVTLSQLAKYQEGYQRHGEPICDFLLKDGELMKVMAKITTGLESKRISGDVAVAGIAIPLSADKTSLVVMTDEKKDNDKYLSCFEGLLRFSAACCEAPSTRRDTGPQAEQMTQAAQAQRPATGPGVGGLQAPPGQPQVAQPGGTVRTPGGQDLQVWSAEDLQQAAQARGGGVPPNMETWSEEDLQKMASERGSGIPEGMEVWTEDDLDELKKSRQGGGLNIPEWKVDDELPECAKCGYTLRKGWSECPVCNTPVGGAPAAPAPKAAPAPAPTAPAPIDAEKPPVPEVVQPPSPEDSQKKDEEKKDENPPSDEGKKETL